MVMRDGRPHGVSLTFELDPQVYSLVDRKEEFNLPVAMREEMDGPPFDDRGNIEIEARLHPQFLDYFAPFADDLSVVESLMHTLPVQEPDHPLVQTSNWFATSVSQNGPVGASRYLTFWRRLRMTSDTMKQFEQGEFDQTVQEFISSKIGLELAQLPKEFVSTDTEGFVAEISQVVTDGLRELFVGLAAEMENNAGADSTDSVSGRATPLEQVALFMEGDGWSWKQGKDEVSLVTGATGDNGEFICQIIWEDTNRYLICYAFVPLETSPERRAAMLEFIARANYGLPSGAFEIDLDDGKVRFRNTLFAENAYPSEKQIAELLYTTVYTTDEYLPGIMRVNDGVSPQLALAEVEDA